MARSKQKPVTTVDTQGQQPEEGESAKEREEMTPIQRQKELTDHKCFLIGKKPAVDGDEAGDIVVRSLFEMATRGKNIAAAIFWTKTRCGAEEKVREHEKQFSNVPTIVIRTEGKQLEV